MSTETVDHPQSELDDFKPGDRVRVTSWWLRTHGYMGWDKWDGSVGSVLEVGGRCVLVSWHHGAGWVFPGNLERLP